MEGVNWKTPMNTKMLRNNQGGSISSFEMMVNPYNIFFNQDFGICFERLWLAKKGFSSGINRIHH